MAKGKQLSFEAAADRLDEILRLLEEDTVSLENSLKLYEEGTRLLVLCDERLHTARQTISKIAEQSSAGEALADTAARQEEETTPKPE